MVQVYRIINWGGVIIAVIGVCAAILRPSDNVASDAHVWPILNAVAGFASYVLPGIDQHRLPFVSIGRFDQAAFIGIYFLVASGVWLTMFLLLYRALVRMPNDDFIQKVAANRRYGPPPYSAEHGRRASLGFGVFTLLLPVSFIGFTGDVYGIVVASVGTNGVVFCFHIARQFLALLRPDGYLKRSD